MIGCFGKKIFEVSPTKISTFEKLDFSESLSTENIESTKGKPATYIKGRELVKVTIALILSGTLGSDPQEGVDEWLSILAAETPQKLILNSKSVTQNKFLLTGVDITDCSYDKRGKLLFCKVALNLQEFVKAGQKNTAKAAKEATKAPAVNYAPKDYYGDIIASAESKAERKVPISKDRMEIYNESNGQRIE